jgi:hypothetical protein
MAIEPLTGRTRVADRYVVLEPDPDHDDDRDRDRDRGRGDDGSSNGNRGSSMRPSRTKRDAAP